VGLLRNIEASATVAFKAADEAILLLGAPAAWGTHLGQSIWLREIHRREDGPPPPVDLAHERRVGDFVRGLVRDRLLTAVHDLSDGGLAVALAEMAMASGIGATVDAPTGDDLTAAFFGEDQGRYLATAPADMLRDMQDLAREAGVALAVIGTTGGHDLKLGPARPITVAELSRAHESWFPDFMAG
jgi:phosphoribosylformylglycinamidine synthase